MSLKPLTQACTPRADVLAGQFAAADFAARLEQVVSDPKGYADYGDPTRFFALTYPTGGMKRLLTGVFGRLSGQDVPGAENPVVRFQTSFGGGKLIPPRTSTALATASSFLHSATSLAGRLPC